MWFHCETTELAGIAPVVAIVAAASATALARHRGV
jgi:hypothetical protein